MNLTTITILSVMSITAITALIACLQKPVDFTLPEETETDPTVKAYIKSLWGEK